MNSIRRIYLKEGERLVVEEHGTVTGIVKRWEDRNTKLIGEDFFEPYDKDEDKKKDKDKVEWVKI